MRISVLSTAFLSVFGLLISACSPTDDQNVEQKPEQLLTYHQDAKPILERYCTGCHVQGGI